MECKSKKKSGPDSRKVGVCDCICCLVIVIKSEACGELLRKNLALVKSVHVENHFTRKATFSTSRVGHDVVCPVSLTLTAEAKTVCY